MNEREPLPVRCWVINAELGQVSYGILPPRALKACTSKISFKGRKLVRMLTGQEGPLTPESVCEFVEAAGWGSLRPWTDEEAEKVRDMTVDGKPTWIPPGAIIIRVDPKSIRQVLEPQDAGKFMPLSKGLTA